MSRGRITDLKLQKRIMADRTGVPLLRYRVVLGAPPTPLPATERHRRAVAQSRFTKVLPGPHMRVRRHREAQRLQNLLEDS